MAKIFISYRRADSPIAGRIYDRLRGHFGDSVFMDVRDIQAGVKFWEQIDAAIGQCNVFLVVIGTKWAGESHAHRRIDDPKDPLRIEIESALKRKIPVIPILVDHARMPAEADLPPSIAELAYRMAIDVDKGRDFHAQIARLIRGIESQIERGKNAVASPLSKSHPGAPDLPVARAPERRPITDPTEKAQSPKSTRETEHPTDRSSGASGSAQGSNKVAHDVFISFSTEDKAIADCVCAMLEATLIRCWIAPRDLQSGIPYPQSIMQGIRGARVLVLILSAKSNISKHVMREVERAVHREIPIVPFRIENVSLSSSLEYLLGSVQWLDAMVLPMESHYEKLAKDVQALLAGLLADE